MIGDGGIGRDHAVRQTIFEEVSDLLLPRTSRLRSLQRPLGLPHCQMCQRHVFNEKNALAVAKLNQRPHNLIMAINKLLTSKRNDNTAAATYRQNAPRFTK